MINLSQSLQKNLISLLISFSRQCQSISNHSTHPMTLSFEITNCLSSVDIRSEKISKVYKTLDQKCTQGHEKICVRKSEYVGCQ